MSQSNNKVPYQGYPYARSITTEVASVSKTEEEAPKSQGGMISSRADTKLAYQGFPNVNRIVTDAPTLNPAEVAAQAKWLNLPRRQLGYTIDRGKNQNSTETSTTSRKDPDPVVYIDLSEESSNPTNSNPNLNSDRPVVYIDIPQGSSGMTDRATDQNTLYTYLQAGSSRENRLTGSKLDLDEDRPVVYIDIPENSGSGVSQSIEEEEPAYVRDTILYDQFKDRRIELPRDSDSEGSQCQGCEHRPGQQRASPPNTLNIAMPGSSGFGSSTSSPAQLSYTTPFQTNETYLYGRTPVSNDEFPLAPLAVNSSPNDLPEHPPPYQEVDTSPVSPVPPASQLQTTAPVTEQPRTQVILNTTTPVMLPGRRKLVRCQHCNATVQTLVVKENGFYTHVLACIVCLFINIFVLCIYCTDYFKYRNHYCPVCNKKIGYEDPTCCSNDITYVN